MKKIFALLLAVVMTLGLLAGCGTAAETPDTDEYTSDLMADIMTEEIEWLPGFPLASDGFSCYRYRKE